jgi:hypothetical protein
MEEANHATDASSIPLIDDNWCDYTPKLLKKTVQATASAKQRNKKSNRESYE